jgi:hypothetical protein
MLKYSATSSLVRLKSADEPVSVPFVECPSDKPVSALVVAGLLSISDISGSDIIVARGICLL